MQTPGLPARPPRVVDTVRPRPRGKAAGTGCAFPGPAAEPPRLTLDSTTLESPGPLEPPGVRLGCAVPLCHGPQTEPGLARDERRASEDPQAVAVLGAVEGDRAALGDLPGKDATCQLVLDRRLDLTT